MQKRRKREGSELKRANGSFASNGVKPCVPKCNYPAAGDGAGRLIGLASFKADDDGAVCSSAREVVTLSFFPTLHYTFLRHFLKKQQCTQNTEHFKSAIMYPPQQQQYGHCMEKKVKTVFYIGHAKNK